VDGTALDALKRISPVFDADLQAASSQRGTECEKVPGGTAPESVRAAIADLEARLNKKLTKQEPSHECKPSKERTTPPRCGCGGSEVPSGAGALSPADLPLMKHALSETSLPRGFRFAATAAA